MPRTLVALGALLAALFLCSCASYRAGVASPPPFQTLAVALAEDRSFSPQVRALLTAALREELSRAGAVAVVDDPAAADAVLTVRLDSVDRSVAVGRSEDSARARKLEGLYRAVATLQDRRSGQAYFTDRAFALRRQIFIGAGQSEAEHQALPATVRALAVEIAHAVTATW